MAISIYDRYPGRAAAPDADYPFGSPKGETIAGANDGTPLQIDWLKDWEGFKQGLMTRADKTPDAVPDNVNGQIITSFDELTTDRIDAAEIALARSPLSENSDPQNQRDIRIYPAGLAGHQGAMIYSGHDDHTTGCIVIGNWLIIVTEGVTIGGTLYHVAVIDKRLSYTDCEESFDWYTAAQITGAAHAAYTIDSISCSENTIFILWRKKTSSYYRSVSKSTINFDTGVITYGAGNELSVAYLNARGSIVAIDENVCVVNNPTGDHAASVSVLDFSPGVGTITDGGGGISSSYVCNNKGLATNGTDIFFTVQSVSGAVDAVFSCTLADPAVAGNLGLLSLSSCTENIEGLVCLGNGASEACRLYLFFSLYSSYYLPRLTVLAPNLSPNQACVTVAIPVDDTPIGGTYQPMAISYDGLRLWLFFSNTGPNLCTYCLPIDPLQLHELDIVEETIAGSSGYSLPVVLPLRVPGHLATRAIPAIDSNDFFIPTTDGIPIIRGARWR